MIIDLKESNIAEPLALIYQRHCKRAFLDKTVDKQLIKTVLEAAANAPSSRNVQPWQVAVLTGESRNSLSAKLCKSFDEGDEKSPDYLNRPKDLPPSLKKRTEEYGRTFFEHKGLDRYDKEARNKHRRENFLFFGAPMELIFHLDRNTAEGAFLDLGFFMQNVMIGLTAFGLGSCPQYSVAGYSNVVRQHLELGQDRIIVSGMAVGYPDEQAHVNQYSPKRAPIDEYVQWHE